jgi:hypothetical protein
MYRYVWVYICIYSIYSIGMHVCMQTRFYTYHYISREMESTGTVTKDAQLRTPWVARWYFLRLWDVVSQPKWPCNNVIHTGNLGSGFRRLQRNQDMTKEFGKNTIFRYLQSSMSDYDSFEPKIIFNRSFGTFTSSNRQMGSHIMTAPRNIWSEIGLKEVVPEAPRCCKICKLLEITHLLRILRS